MWSGCVGRGCAVKASVRGMCECAGVVLVVRVSLIRRLSSAAVDLCEEK